jgi:hypothetical protein
VGGCERGTAHSALFLFPRDALGNVFGWLMLSDSPAALTDALHERPTDAIRWWHIDGSCGAAGMRIAGRAQVDLSCAWPAHAQCQDARRDDCSHLFRTLPI